MSIQPHWVFKISRQKALRSCHKTIRWMALEERHLRLSANLHTCSQKSEHTHTHTHTNIYTHVHTQHTHAPTPMHKYTYAHKGHSFVIPSWWSLLDLRHALLLWSCVLNSSGRSCSDSLYSLSSCKRYSCPGVEGKSTLLEVQSIRAENLPWAV